MEHHFYPSVFGRILYFISSIGMGLVFLLMLLMVNRYGVHFSYDGPDDYEAITVAFLIICGVLSGVITYHLLRLTFSPWPTLIVTDQGFRYRFAGVYEATEVKWQDVLIAQRKGVLKDIYLTIWLRETAHIRQNENPVYRLARRLSPALLLTGVILFTIPTYPLLLLNGVILYINRHFPPFAQKAKPKRIKIRVSRLSLGQHLSDVQALIQEKIALSAERSSAPNQYQNLPRNQNRPYLRKTVLAGVIWCIALSPMAGFTLGLTQFSRDLRTDPAVKVTQRLYNLATIGDADAQNKLGWRYQKGKGTPKSDRRAVKWYRLAAEQGFAKAQYNLGLAYQYKHGAEQSYEKAIDWYQKAASQGFAPAQTSLGFLHLKGEGIASDYNTAKELFEHAALQKEAQAFYYLGHMYEKGKGVPLSRDKAITYYKTAAHQGNASAIKALKRLALKDTG